MLSAYFAVLAKRLFSWLACAENSLSFTTAQLPDTNRLSPLKHLFIAIVLPFVCLRLPHSTPKPQQEMYWGTIFRTPLTMWFEWMTGRY
jgi:hypothetical protein